MVSPLGIVTAYSPVDALTSKGPAVSMAVALANTWFNNQNAENERQYTLEGRRIDLQGQNLERLRRADEAADRLALRELDQTDALNRAKLEIELLKARAVVDNMARPRSTGPVLAVLLLCLVLVLVIFKLLS
ncbi:hypothetical protein OIV83_002898 [Microbotryomycetes sp. JL201]|nr:hypothetical protein OIV83_002898 [Microbotryomycetes sp. JL201]